MTWNKLEKETQASSLQKQLVAENTRKQLMIYQARPYVGLVDEMSRLDSVNTALKRSLWDELKFLDATDFKVPTMERLKAFYKIACKFLTQRYLRTEGKGNSHEEEFASNIRANMERKKFYHSLWIGPFQADFFIPRASRTGRTNGIVYEINGPSHHNELKVKKDTLKQDFLIKHVGILYREIENDRINHPSTIRELRDLKRTIVHHKTLKHVWKKIYIETIVAFSFTKQGRDYLQKLLGLDSGQIQSLT